MPVGLSLAVAPTIKSKSVAISATRRNLSTLFGSDRMTQDPDLVRNGFVPNTCSTSVVVQIPIDTT